MTFGSTDSDAFQCDGNAGRMTQYKATINTLAVNGTLTWNANWTLQKLVTVDPFNSGNNGKTCTNTYDDLARLSSVDCLTGNWGQTFSYVDNFSNVTAAFGNISKSVITSPSHIGQSFSAQYSDTTNRLTTVGGTSVTYDNNGNLTYDGFHHYSWDGEGKLATLDGNVETYDALGRRVEQYNGSAYTEIVYSVDGSKLALMNGQTVTKVFAPLTGGATAVYASSGLAYYRHPDWLGSSRIASTPLRAIYYDAVYAPFGEPYAETGTTDRNFTGQDQDLTPGVTGDMYDFLYREYHPTQGRWISPDPAGMAAVDPTNPQSLNRYAYTLNNPLRYVDPSGLNYCSPNSFIYDNDGSFVGYDDSQCVSDEKYGDGSGYEGYVYVGTGSTGGTETSLVQVDPVRLYSYSSSGPFGSSGLAGTGLGAGAGFGQVRANAPNNGTPDSSKTQERLERLKNCALGYYGIDPLGVTGLSSYAQWGLIALSAGGIPKSVAAAIGLRVIMQPGASQYTSALSMLSLATGGGGALRTIANFGSKWAGPIAIASAVVDATAIGVCTALE